MSNNYYEERAKTDRFIKKVIIATIILSIILMLIMALAFPYYRVWAQDLRGQAALAEARSSKLVQVEQARGELESSKLRAEAIEIIGKAAKQYPEYRNQEFIGAFGEALRSGVVDQIIYVPTEANIPILEAGKRSSLTDD